MRKENSQVQEEKFSFIKKNARKAMLAAVLGTGLATPPVAIYAKSYDDGEIYDRSQTIAEMSDNKAVIATEAVALTAGVAFTIGAHLYGRKYDEKWLHFLRVAGPALISTGIGSAIAETQIQIDYGVPFGLAIAGSYAMGAANIRSTFTSTRDKGLRAASIATAVSIGTLSNTAFLAASGNL